MRKDKRSLDNKHRYYREITEYSYFDRKIEIVEELIALLEKDIRLDEEYRLETQKDEQIVMNYKQACRTFMDHPDEVVKLFYRDLDDIIFQLFKGVDIETIRKMRRGEVLFEKDGTASDVSGKFLDGRLHICHVWVRGSDYYLFYDSKAAKAAMYRSKPKGESRHLYEMKYDRESGKVFYGWVAENPKNIKETSRLLRDHFEGRYTPVLPEKKNEESKSPGEKMKPVSESDNYRLIQDKWEAVLQYVKRENDVSDISYATWLNPLKPLMLLNGKLYIITGLDVLADYIEKKYGPMIEWGITSATGLSLQVQFVPENVCSAPL